MGPYSAVSHILSGFQQSYLLLFPTPPQGHWHIFWEASVLSWVLDKGASLQGHRLLCPQPFTSFWDSEIIPFGIRKPLFQLPGCRTSKSYILECHWWYFKQREITNPHANRIYQVPLHAKHFLRSILSIIAFNFSTTFYRWDTWVSKKVQWQAQGHNNGNGQVKINLRLLSTNMSLILTKILCQADVFM